MVSAYVRELILTGAVRSGEFLRAEAIAASLGVSNTPVREGLLGLCTEGMVRLVPRRGFVVASLGRTDIEDLYWAASRLAGELAARAARSGGGPHIELASDSIRAMDDAVASADLAAVARSGHEFHRHINLAASSDRLASLLRSMVNNLPLRFYASVEAQLGDTAAAHQRIYDAVHAGDAVAAESAMSAHVLEGADRLIAMLGRRGVWA